MIKIDKNPMEIERTILINLRSIYKTRVEALDKQIQELDKNIGGKENED